VIKEVEVPRVRNEIIEVQKPVYVDKIVEVPVNRIVEIPHYVERKIEVPREIEVRKEIYVDKFVDIPVEKIVEIPIEVIKKVEVPLEKRVAKYVEVA
jgi:hypothetical protein